MGSFLRLQGWLEHTEEHRECEACQKAKASLELFGGKEITRLFEHVGKVEEADSYQEAVDKVIEGIRKQTNQALARFRLLNQMPQQKSAFAEWYPKIRDQAGRCVWAGYKEDSAARDMILIQTSNSQLQKKIIAEDLNYKDTVKYGLAIAHSDKKVKELGKGQTEEGDRVATLEDVRKLQSSDAKKKKIFGRKQ